MSGATQKTGTKKKTVYPLRELVDGELVDGVRFINLYEPSSALFETRTKKSGTALDIVEIDELRDNVAARTQLTMDPVLASDIRKSITNAYPHPLPVFLIQSHGLYSTELQLVRSRELDNHFAVRWKRGGEEFIKQAQVGQWIINTTPMDAVGLCTQLENKFVDQMAMKLGSYRNCLLSARARDVLSMRPAHASLPLVNPQMFIPPTGLYADKEHQTWDDEKTWSWYMVVLPLFQPTNMPLLEAKLGFKLVAGKPDQAIGRNDAKGMRDRLVNRRIYDDKHFWIAGTKNPYWAKGADGAPVKAMPGQVPTQAAITALRARYFKLTRLWEKSLPVFASSGHWEGGDTVKLSKMMETLGDGMYISMTCSPMVMNNRWAGNLHKEQQLTLQSISTYLNEVIEASNRRWVEIFSLDPVGVESGTQSKTRGCTPLVLEGESDVPESLFPEGPETRRRAREPGGKTWGHLGGKKRTHRRRKNRRTRRGKLTKKRRTIKKRRTTRKKQRVTRIKRRIKRIANKTLKRTLL